ncbi:MAG: SpoIIE family protein phosphatase [Candidatus Latescibacterota bacterium]|nr:MAG: SpoIIE family protein phosphatase [Candidatus Latescibacterota bacterium]
MGDSYTLLLSIFYLTGGVFIFLLGLTILRTGTSSTPTRATALILFFAGLGPILSATSIILQSTLREDAMVYRSMVENFEYLWEFYFPSLLLFALSYPREYGVIRNSTFFGLILFAPYIFHLVTIMAGEGVLKSVLDMSKNLPLEREVSVGERTLSLSGAGSIVSVLFTTLVKLHKQLFLIVNILYASAGLYFITRSMRLHVNPRITGQLKTVLVGLTVSIIGYTLAKLIPMAPGRLGSENMSLALINFSLVAGGGSVAYAVVKQQFLGIRHVARRSVLYGGAALMFAAVYLLVVKPVSDFFGQYSVVSKEAFETGFIILTIIAFQPTLLRIEEMLERILLKGKDDLQQRFKGLGSEISNVTSEDELERLLQSRLQDILDATSVSLNLGGEGTRTENLVGILEQIGEPIMRHEILKLAEKGRLWDDNAGSQGSARDQSNDDLAREREAEVEALVGEDEVLVPIMRERKCIGFVALGEKTHGLRYGAEELAMLSVISDQIGVALDNVRLLRENVEKKVLEEELQIARRVQSRLLPGSSPHIAGYDLSASTIPARHVGGDYYDFQLLDDGTLVLVVADVSGKGMPASLLMATLRAAVNSNADVRERPADMLQRINSLLYESTSAEEFATVFYGVVKLGDGEMKYASAGHEFPYLVSREGIRQLGGGGTIIGCIKDYSYTETSCRIPNGGTLILYTDGIIDAATTDGESFGEERLRNTLERSGDMNSRDLCSSILVEVREFSREGEYQDDLTLVVLKRE